MRTIRLAGAACLAAALGLAAADVGAGGAGGDKTYKTPQAVFAAAQAASRKNDGKALSACLTDESRAVVTGQMLQVAMLIKAFADFDKSGKGKETVKSIDAVLAKHGVTKERQEKMKKGPAGGPPKGGKDVRKFLKALAEPIEDRSGFIADILAVLAKMPGAKANAGPLGNAELKEVKVDGNSAKGSLVTKRAGKEQREPIAFKKVRGSWKIEIPDEALAPKPGKLPPPPPPPAKE